jgi:glycine cleavage system H protein
MVLILVVLTIAIALGIDAVRTRRRGTAHALARVKQAATAVLQRYFHPGHSWAEVGQPDVVTVGSDEWIPRLMGASASVEIAAAGTAVKQGEPLAVVRRGTRSLTVVSPVTGTLASVNTELAADPSLLGRSPYEKGWIARVSPARLRLDLNNLLQGAVADRWRDSFRLELLSYLSPQVGPVLQDGGEWVDGVGDLLSDAEWNALVRSLFPAQQSGQSNSDTK